MPNIFALPELPNSYFKWFVILLLCLVVAAVISVWPTAIISYRLTDSKAVTAFITLLAFFSYAVPLLLVHLKDKYATYQYNWLIIGICTLLAITLFLSFNRFSFGRAFLSFGSITATSHLSHLVRHGFSHL